MSGSESDDKFFDGYDEDLIGDEEDRKRLEQMTEKEREQELYNRSERRAVLKTRLDINFFFFLSYFGVYSSEDELKLSFNH